MSEFENTVAFDDMSEELFADDAQTMDAEEMSIEELTANLTGEGDQTAENEGDGDPVEGEPAGESTKKNSGNGRQIAAALRSQKEKIFRDLGMSENEIRELILDHKSRKMHEEDPDISPKAARRILEAQSGGARADLVAGVRSLQEDGWTADELAEFTTDPNVQRDIAQGKTVRQAATAYLRRGAAPQKGTPVTTTKKRAVPTTRNTAAGSAPATNRIESMSDAEFDKLDRQIMDAAMSGRRVRLD